VVKVLNLFHNLPVRRCSTRKEAELSSIREYVQHMSVLHHSVHWSLQLLCPPHSSSSILGRSSQLHIAAPIRRSSSSSCLLDLVAQGSVIDRLTAIHGRSIISKLEVCCVCYCMSYYL
jgi:DNA mismatch repair ATPase MutL